jgi:hypothetical protein
MPCHGATQQRLKVPAERLKSAQRFAFGSHMSSAPAVAVLIFFFVDSTASPAPPIATRTV